MPSTPKTQTNDVRECTHVIIFIPYTPSSKAKSGMDISERGMKTLAYPGKEHGRNLRGNTTSLHSNEGAQNWWNLR
jgi:hypothetical protein